MRCHVVTDRIPQTPRAHAHALPLILAHGDVNHDLVAKKAQICRKTASSRSASTNCEAYHALLMRWIARCLFASKKIDTPRTSAFTASAMSFPSSAPYLAPVSFSFMMRAMISLTMGTGNRCRIGGRTTNVFSAASAFFRSTAEAGAAILIKSD